MTNIILICLVLIYGIYVLDKRMAQIIDLLRNKETHKDIVYVRGPSDIDIKTEVVKNQTVSVDRKPEEFSSAISRASAVKGFGNM